MATQHHHTTTTTADVIVDVAVGDAVIPIHEHRQVDVNAVPKREWIVELLWSFICVCAAAGCAVNTPSIETEAVIACCIGTHTICSFCLFLLPISR